MNFSEALRQGSEPAWTAATTHRFTRELGQGTLDLDVMRRYLVQDYAFIESLVSMIGYGVAKAPDMAAKKQLSAFLAALTSDENTYFLRCFDALEIPESDRVSPRLLPVSRAFLDNLQDAGANGAYGEIIATLLAAEWVYLAWGMDERNSAPGTFWFQEWIDLHANPAFEDFVNWLRQEADRIGATATLDLQQKMATRFKHMVDLEVAFFDAAYSG